MKKNILFLLFIFSALGFLFFKADFARGAEGMCTCDIIHTDTGEQEGPVEVTDESEDACSALETSSPSENLLYQNCMWENKGGICQCAVKYTQTEETKYEKIDGIGTEEKCKGLVTQTSGGGADQIFTYESCEWQAGQELQSISGGESASPQLDLPSVAGLKQLKNDDIKSVFGNIIKVAMGLMGSIALALFAYAGVLWMLSGGNSEQATKARNIVVWAVLGLFVIFASYTIVSFIFSAVE